MSVKSKADRPATDHTRHKKAAKKHHDRLKQKHAAGAGAALNGVSGGASPVLAAPGSAFGLTVAPELQNMSAWGELSTLLGRGLQPPAFLIPIYKAAARRYDIPWQILASINAIETDYGRNLNVSSAGAVGWMQFMPATWRRYGVAVRGHGDPNPYDPRDAIFAAARYLAANGGRKHLKRAIFAYNHADWYVDEVIWTASLIEDRRPARGTQARVRLDAMLTMALALDGQPYIWGGGHAAWEMAPGYDCSGFISAVLHAGGYLEQPATTQTLPADRHILPGPGRYVTIFDRTDGGSLDQDHVLIDLNGQWWESGGADGGGVHPIKDLSPAYLLTFNQILHPRGL